jgi:hypothetical protein
MRLKSVYTVACVCGHSIECETKETVCPSCKRQIGPGEWDEAQSEPAIHRESGNGVRVEAERVLVCVLVV